MSSAPRKAGKVYLVGAGPGDPGLLTIKGAECLRRADLVVYDRLGTSPELLALAPESAERVFMGKEPETPGGFQQLISKTLAAAALEGKIWGAGMSGFSQESVESLKDQGCDFLVFDPGSTSATALGDDR